MGKTRGRPANEQSAIPSTNAAVTTTSSSKGKTNTFRERWHARQGIGLYTAESGNSYYHGSMRQRRVFHVNRGAHTRSQSRRQHEDDLATHTTQESRASGGHDGASTSGQQGYPI